MFKIPIALLSRLRLINPNEIYKLWEVKQLQNFFDIFQIDCVFDVGANKGQYADMLRTEIGFKGWILSFEPNPELAEILNAKSKCDPKWLICNYALSKSEGIYDFNVMTDSQFSSFNNPKDTLLPTLDSMNQIARIVPVKTRTINSIFPELQETYRFERPFLKMDTQGHDTDVFSGASSCILNFLGMQSELAIQKIYQDGMGFHDALRLYEANGFSLSSFIPNNQGWFPHLFEVDCLLVRNNLLNLPRIN